MEDTNIKNAGLPVISETVSKRITSLRFLLACLVVMFHNNKTLLFVLSQGGLSFSNSAFLGHLPQFIFQYVITVAPVPLFFIFSSYLSTKKNYPYLVMLKKKFKSLFLPFILWPAIVIVGRIVIKAALILVFPDKVSHEIPFVNEWNLRDWLCAFFGYYFPSYNCGDLCEPFILPLYFIRDLLIMDILSPLIKKIIRLSPVPFFIFLMALFFMNVRPVIVCTNALVFYSLGIYFAEYDFDFFAFADKISWKQLLIFVLIFIGIFIRYKSPYYVVLLSCVILLKISKIIAESSEKTFAVFKYLSGYSFFLYAVHDAYILMIFTSAWFKFVPQNYFTDFLEYFLIAPMVCIVGTVIGIALKKISPKIFYLLNGR